MTVYGYGRVSTRDQSPRLQTDALRAAGCTEVFEETGGGVRERPTLTALLTRMQTSDVLITWKMDRLGRSARQILDIIADLRDRGIVWKSLTEGMDTATPIGRLGLHILAGVALLREIVVDLRSTVDSLGQALDASRKALEAGQAERLVDRGRAERAEATAAGEQARAERAEERLTAAEAALTEARTPYAIRLIRAFRSGR